MNYKKFYIVFVAAFISVILIGCEKEHNSIDLETFSDESVAVETEISSEIYVHISGAVKNPGVYGIESGSRLYQVIELAGGMTKKAERNVLNLAETVSDGQKIHIMSRKEYKNSLDDEGTKESFLTDTDVGVININTASAEELTGLPGIGASKAAAIVSYREENGLFSAIEEIKNVSGIGDATFSNIKSMITVN